jgi:hypothetical protein
MSACKLAAAHQQNLMSRICRYCGGIHHQRDNFTPSFLVVTDTVAHKLQRRKEYKSATCLYIPLQDIPLDLLSYSICLYLVIPRTQNISFSLHPTWL